MVKSSIQQGLQNPEQKKRSHNMIHREKQNRKAVLYKPLSLLFQECCEASALDVVSQHWSFSFLAFLPPFPPRLTFFVLTACTWRRKETLAA